MKGSELESTEAYSRNFLLPHEKQRHGTQVVAAGRVGVIAEVFSVALGSGLCVKG